MRNRVRLVHPGLHPLHSYMFWHVQKGAKATSVSVNLLHGTTHCPRSSVATLQPLPIHLQVSGAFLFLAANLSMVMQYKLSSIGSPFLTDPVFPSLFSRFLLGPCSCSNSLPVSNSASRSPFSTKPTLPSSLTYDFVSFSS